MPLSRSGDAGNTYTSKWPYFNLMLFLKDVVRPRSSSGNLSKASIPHDVNKLDDTQFTTLDPADPSTATPPPLSPQQETSENYGQENQTPPAQECSYIQTKKKRQRPTQTFNEALLEIERKKLEYITEKSEHKRQKENESEDDEHLHFFKSLLPHVRKIPQSKQLSFRNRVQELVEQYAYQQHFSSPNTPYSSHSTLTTISHDTPELPDPYQSPPPANISQSLLDYTQF
mgnify:CR=1 FL=1